MSKPYLTERPVLPPLPLEWDHIPTLAELRRYRLREEIDRDPSSEPPRAFPLFPGVEYCWVLASNRKIATTREGWQTLRNVDMFTINGHPAVLMGRGEPIAGARLDCTWPTLNVDPDLEAKVNPPVVVPEPAPEKREGKRQ